MILSAMSDSPNSSSNDTFNIARESVRMWCARRERSTAQCKKKLATYDLSTEQTDEILTGLEQENYLSDERYADAFTSGHIRIKRWGRMKIQRHLAAEGIPESVVRKAFDEQVDPAEYDQNMRDLLNKKLKTLGDCSHPAERQKAIRYMQQRGYETEKVITLLEELAGD